MGSGRNRIVLYVITGLHTGGAERMLGQLLMALDRRWAPVVISLSDGGRPEDSIKAMGIPVHSLGLRAGRLPGPVSAWRLIRLVRKIRPDLIQGWMYHGNLAAQFANIFLPRRVPVIWGIHHSIGSLEAEKGMTRKMIRLGAGLSGLPEKIVYVSETSKEQHITLGYRAEKAVVIPNGIDPGHWLPDKGARAVVRKELGLASDAFLIGSLARYHPVKDHENFLRAAALSMRRYQDGENGQIAGGAGSEPHFILAGAGVDKRNETLRSLIGELGLSGRVHLMGERRDPEQFLAALDLFTISSFSEALPMVLLEAMSCGVCSVATDTGDIARVIGDTGRVMPVRDPAALAGAWEELIREGEEKIRSLGAAARARAAAQYTLSACASAHDALYRELIGY
jgi:glycosyltransferase involved in cell wall biosynthesis